jgi:hypothetical protein
MKTTLIGIIAATLLATPAFAAGELSTSELKQIAATQVVTPVAGSWRTQLFARLDSNTNGELSVLELEQTGCAVKKKFFAVADANKNSALSKNEFFSNRALFSRCK